MENFVLDFGILRFAQLGGALFLTVLFLQSGLDKIFQWTGNLSWLKGHFSKTPFKTSVPILLFIVTLFEVAAGLFSGIGAISILVDGSLGFAALGGVLAMFSLGLLFTGQRMAQDYEGAATLASYFALVLLYLFLLHS